MNLEDGSIHHGLTVGCAFSDTAPAEDRATVLLAGMVAEYMLFGSHGQRAKRDLDMAEKLVEEIRSCDGEKRTAEQIRNDLIADTKKLLATHKDSLDLLYSEAVERAEQQHGFAAFEKNGYAVELLTGEMLQYVSDSSKGKIKPDAANVLASAPRTVFTRRPLRSPVRHDTSGDAVIDACLGKA